jgi:hypothetical protein
MNNKKRSTIVKAAKEDEIDWLQQQLTPDFIKHARNEFRQCGQINEGRIQKKNFKQVMEKLGVRDERAVDQLF